MPKISVFLISRLRWRKKDQCEEGLTCKRHRNRKKEYKERKEARYYVIFITSIDNTLANDIKML